MRLPGRGAKDGSYVQAREADQPPPEPAVAFLKFSIDGGPAAGTHYLTPGETHDLEIEVRVSRWPEAPAMLELRPLSIDRPQKSRLPDLSPRKTGGDRTVHHEGQRTCNGQVCARSERAAERVPLRGAF
jgi:hypothetical protein